MLRVFSDLHVFDGSSRIESLRQLDPLTHDVDALLINGDSCDTQVGATADQIEELRAYLAGRAPRVTFVTGNHDPDISEVHELLLGDGRIWATHGDVLYANATPWSRLLPELERRIATARSQRPQVPLDRIESRLEIFRQISRRLPSEDDIRRRDLRSRLVRLLRDVGSVRRVRAILRAWQTAPDLAAALAR
ncbi:MAG TPA: metallophosphoesterase, partial [Candidatus Synoicihabitans sp.]|nr:metallophosphoesterase [Candidatus Synoicihabitans sp.]